jgi:hypothetical protein
VNEPGPVPSEVLLSLTEGFAPVAQQTPRAVTLPEPSSVTVPPHETETAVSSVIAEVETTGIVCFLHEKKRMEIMIVPEISVL